MRRSLVGLTCALALAGGAGQTRAAAYVFTTIPGVASANGVNDLGQIVGINGGTNNSTGFVDTAGSIQVFVAPSNPPSASIGTHPTAINNNGQIVGWGSEEPGFLKAGNIYTPLDSGDSLQRGYFITSGINDSGEIVGSADIYSGPTVRDMGTTESFLLSGNTSTKIVIPAAGPSLGGFGVNVTANGINNAGEIVGQYINSSYHGFLDNAGIITEISVPGAPAGATDPTSISNTGEVAGTYEDALGYHGFLFENGSYTTVDAPGSTFTNINGINSAGEIVGVDSFGAFFATPVAVPEPASITLLSMGLAALGLAARRRRTDA